MAEDQWQWQEPGTAWRGVCTYHITLTVPSRQPLLGRLVIPKNDPSLARVERTALGNAVVDELYVMCKRYPAIRIFQFCLMPDHLHAVIRVTKVMDTSIRSVIRGYWQGVKKLGRAYTLAVSSEAGTLEVSSELNSGTITEGKTTTHGGTITEERQPITEVPQPQKRQQPKVQQPQKRQQPKVQQPQKRQQSKDSQLRKVARDGPFLFSRSGRLFGLCHVVDSCKR